MNKRPINIALLSPNNKAYSESFIRAHKEKIEGHVSYYYGGYIPRFLEGTGDLYHRSLPKRVRSFLLRRIKRASDSSIRKEMLLTSFKREKIDIVLAEYGPTGAECFEICRQSDIPLIVHFHGYDAYMTGVMAEYGGKYLEMFQYASGIVAVSNAMKQQLIKLGAEKKKIIVNPCGPGNDFHNIKINYQVNSFISNGRFVDKKAPYYTLAAFHEILKNRPEARLIMIGNGPLLPTCKNLARYFGIDQSIEFLGSIDHEKVKEVCSKAFCFVQHSITAENGDSEGTPVSVLEANVAGLPVISTNHAGIPEVIIHEKTGLLVEEHDVKQMAQYMLQLFDDRKTAEELGKKGRQHVYQNYMLDSHIKKLDELISSVIIGNAE